MTTASQSEKKPRFPLTEKSRNLVRFCRHLPHEQLHESFSADFGFRAELSRFSILKNYGTLPGPDDAFSHLQLDAQSLFSKLLGLEIEYPGAPWSLQPYSSMNYYRSHIEEVFHHTGPQHSPFPPVEGRCVTFFAGTDVLRVEYELRNKSTADVAMRLRWFSVPSVGLSSSLKLLPDGFRHACVQKVTKEYEASATVTGCAFRQADGRLESDWEDILLPANANFVRSFEILFNDADPGAKPLDLAGAIANVEARYTALPELPERFRRFEPLALRAAGIVLSSRFLETDPHGHRVQSLHGGKTGIEAAWFWDSATSQLGIGLMQDVATGWGSFGLLCDGIAEDGKPFTRYCDGEYAPGAQNPILAWGVWNFYALCPDQDQLARNFPALERYVKWWLRTCDATGGGLYVWPSGMSCTGLDDTLQWCENFPIALQPGESWTTKNWGHSALEKFESVDINCQLYLEMKALALMARALDLPAEAGE